jgi:flagellar biosynthesis regulator FlaF
VPVDRDDADATASIALMRASKNSQADSLESIEWLQVSP